MQSVFQAITVKHELTLVVCRRGTALSALMKAPPLLNERCNLLWKWHYVIWDPRKTFSGSFITLVLRWTRTGARLYFRQRSRRVLSRYVQRWYTVPFLKQNSDWGADHVFQAVFGISDLLFHYFLYFVLLAFAIFNRSQNLHRSGHALFRKAFNRITLF